MNSIQQEAPRANGRGSEGREGMLEDAVASVGGQRAVAPGPRGSADIHVALSRVLWERGDLAGVAEQLRLADELGESAGLPQNPYRWRVAMAHLREAQGDTATAVGLLEEAEKVYVGDFSPNVRPVAAGRVRALAASGAVAEGLAWAHHRGVSATDDLTYLHEYEHVTLVRVLLADHAASGRKESLADAAALLNPPDDGVPLPVVVHITCAVPYAVLGAFQFSSRLRRHPRWHRAAGRVVMGPGLAVALSGLWMALFYPRQPGTGELALVFRLTFGSGMAACIVLGFFAIHRGDVATHKAWMTRAYAIAVAAGTQAFTQGIAKGAFGTSTLTTDLALGADWVINLAVAELVLHRYARPRVARAITVTGSP